MWEKKRYRFISKLRTSFLLVSSAGKLNIFVDFGRRLFQNINFSFPRRLPVTYHRSTFRFTFVFAASRAPSVAALLCCVTVFDSRSRYPSNPLLLLFFEYVVGVHGPRRNEEKPENEKESYGKCREQYCSNQIFAPRPANLICGSKL